MDIQARFDAKYMPEPNSGCWLWTGATDRWGYGMLWDRGRMRSAHRISHVLFLGEIPTDKIVCHTCDMPSCVNPDHLWLGSHKDNADDRDRKDRVIFGEKHSSAKLCSEDAVAIRNSPLGKKRLAKMYGVSPSLIKQIKHRKIWKRA